MNLCSVGFIFLQCLVFVFCQNKSWDVFQIGKFVDVPFSNLDVKNKSIRGGIVHFFTSGLVSFFCPGSFFVCHFLILAITSKVGKEKRNRRLIQRRSQVLTRPRGKRFDLSGNSSWIQISHNSTSSPRNSRRRIPSEGYAVSLWLLVA